MPAPQPGAQAACASAGLLSPCLTQDSCKQTQTPVLPGSPVLRARGGGKNTGVGCHFLLQEIFPTWGSNPGLPHCRQKLYRLSHQGSHNPQVINPILYSLLEPTAPPTTTGSTKVHWKEHWTQSQEQRGQVLALPLTLDMTVYPEALVR